MSALVLLELCIASTILLQGDVQIALDRQAGKTGQFEVRGLPAQQAAQLAQRDGDWSRVFSVYVGESADAAAPMLGKHSLVDGVLRFEPRFPLQPGLAYTAVFRPGAGRSGNVTRAFSIPAPPNAPPTEVAHVYPTRTIVPENLLKLYLHFSAPMSRGDSYRHLRLLDAEGAEIDLPFLELGEELWNDEGTRLTVFFDPGRIKRGLKPREEAGPVLEEGKSYTLLIGADWLDATGRPLKSEFRKPLESGPPDDRQPDASRWQIQAPAARSREPLVLRFEEPLDHAMLQRVLVVRDPSGEKVAGEIQVDREETRWQFRPRQPWKAGGHRVTVDTTLEDLAGNSLGRPFEIDVFGAVERKVTQEMIDVPFEAR